MKSRFEPTRKALIFWCLFIGIGALAGGTAMLLDPSGKVLHMDEMLPYFQAMPLAEQLYQNFIFPGIALLCVNCIPNLIAAVLLLRRKKAGILCGGLFGVTLMAWIVIQFVIFPSNILSNLYFDFGILQALTGIAAWIFYRQEQFRVDVADYPKVGTNPQRLVVYFSRMGYVKKKALEEANRTGAALYEVKATERTAGTLGFWWCGRYGMHAWEMHIEEITVDLTQFERVCICSPIWVFRLCAPMRTFCHKASGKIRAFDCILVHHQKNGYENAVQEMERLLGISCDSAVSHCNRQGSIRKTLRLRETKTA